MKTRVLSDSDVEALLRREEGHFLDFKSKDIDGKRLQKIAVAFANADGGEILLGIEEKKIQSLVRRTWQGFESPENANSLLQALFSLSPSVPLKYEFLHDSRTFVLRVLVEKSNQVHPTARLRHAGSTDLVREDFDSRGNLMGPS
jgi:ATP-dependent DNA helicase RecG